MKGRNYVTMDDILQLKTGYREEANKKRARAPLHTAYT